MKTAVLVLAVLSGHAVVDEPLLADHLAAEGCYAAPAAPTRRASFLRLLEAALAEEALAAAGVARVTDAEVEADAARVERETRAPETLACVKARLGGDAARYRRAFVRPRLVEARLRAHLGRERLSPEKFFAVAPKPSLRVTDPELRSWLVGLRGNPRLAALDPRP